MRSLTNVLGACLSAGFVAALALPALADVPFPAPLAAALEEADARAEKDLRLTFTRIKEGPADVTFSAEFDPLKPHGEQWTILAPPKGSWSPKQKQSIDLLFKQKDADRPLIITSDAARRMLGDDIAVLREEAGRIVYVSSVAGPPLGTSSGGQGGDIEDYLKYLRAEITVATAPASVEALRIFAPAPFRPYGVAHVARLDIKMDLAPAWTEGPIAISAVTREVKASAALISFDETVNLTYKDYAPVK